MWSFHGSVAQVFGAVEDFAGVGDDEDAFLFAPLPCMGVDVAVVEVAEVDAAAAFCRDAGCQCYLDARRFGVGGEIVGA